VIPREGVESELRKLLISVELRTQVIPREGVERGNSVALRRLRDGVIPREGVESPPQLHGHPVKWNVIPREGVESNGGGPCPSPTRLL